MSISKDLQHHQRTTKTIRNMKPIITFALSAVLAITLSSCNNQSSQSSQPSLERLYIVWPDIDTDIQQIVMDEVDARRSINHADWACAIVLNERGEGITGYEIRRKDTTMHRYLTDKQAIGTIFMPFSLLMTSVTSFVDSSFTVPVQKKGWCPLGGKEIVDSHPRDTILRVRDIIAASSYQGAGRAFMASTWLKSNGVKNFKWYLNKLGCDSSQFCQWSEYASITGTDVITTPEHIALLYHCLTHGSFHEEWHVESSGVLEGLHDCVWNNDLGTASVTMCGDDIIYDRAQSDKVAIMGKTGTVTIDKDPHKHVISFVGIFPEDNPQYTCLVMFGNPQGAYSAGVDCGGTVRRIAERIMTK